MLRLAALLVVLDLAACRPRTEPAPPEREHAQPDEPDGGSADVLRADVVAKESPQATNASIGPIRRSTRAPCAGLVGKVAPKDLVSSFVDGDDLLALVNRAPTGALASDWAPSDLVDVHSKKPASPSDCEKAHCLRREAAFALDELLAAMKKEGFAGKIESAFRSYGAQCGTFLDWAEKGSFCDATEQSALPGHSQHQLGTTVDLFTEEWAKDDRGVFRAGFGCTNAGVFLREHAEEAGFVLPYPIHPDDRHPKRRCVTRWDIPVGINPKTGYRYEHWHFRYIGRDAAKRFGEARRATEGTPDEITLEQWLRSEKGIRGGDAELPVCDGCNCGACSTLAAPMESSCDKKGGALHLDELGLHVAAAEPPTLLSAARARSSKGRAVGVAAEIRVSSNVTTQPPIAGRDAAEYRDGATAFALSPYPDTAPRSFPPLDDAWMIGIEPVPNETGVAWPYRAALAAAVHGRLYNRANVRLPAKVGTWKLHVAVPAGVRKARVVMLRSGLPSADPLVVDL